MTENVNRLVHEAVQEAVQKVRDWAAATRPLLSDPPEGQEWQVHLHPFTGEDFNSDTGEINMRYEWVLVVVPS
jgi:hypothetical protein